MSKILDMYIKGVRGRTFEHQLNLVVEAFGKTIYNKPISERTIKEIEKLNPEKKSEGTSVKIDNNSALFKATKDVGMLKKLNTMIGLSSATVGLTVGLAAFINYAKTDAISLKEETPIETVLDNEDELIKENTDILQEEKPVINDFSSKNIEKNIKPISIKKEDDISSYEHTIPDIKDLPNITDSTSDIYHDYYSVYEVNTNEVPFSDKEIVIQKYGDSIKSYSKDYGIDPELYLSLLCQENGSNLDEEGIKELRKREGRPTEEVSSVGIAQISKANDGGIINVFNRSTNEYETLKIDIERCTNDTDYCIKCGAMILAYNIDAALKHKNPVKSDEEAILYGFAGYNLSPQVAVALAENNYTFEENCKYISSQCGDYINLALRTVEDGYTATFITPEGKEVKFVVDNANIDKFNAHLDSNAKIMR